MLHGDSERRTTAVPNKKGAVQEWSKTGRVRLLSIVFTLQMAHNCTPFSVTSFSSELTRRLLLVLAPGYPPSQLSLTLWFPFGPLFRAPQEHPFASPALALALYFDKIGRAPRKVLHSNKPSLPGASVLPRRYETWRSENLLAHEVRRMQYTGGGCYAGPRRPKPYTMLYL